MDMAFDKINAGSLTEAAVQSLLGKILSGELRTGEWLPPERELAEQMGISRSSVHLAVLELAGKGFLEIIPRRGTVVSDYRKHPTPDSLPLLMSYGSVELEQSLFSDMMETRLLLETEAARLACDHIYDNTFWEMQELLEQLKQPQPNVTDILYGFHYRLVQASGNSIYSMIFRGFEPVLRSLITLHYRMQANDLPKSIQHHQELLNAIRDKNQTMASQIAREIILQGIGVIESQYDWAETNSTYISTEKSIRE
jgi:DNA-binding FadR family transcriptional regulator